MTRWNGEHYTYDAVRNMLSKGNVKYSYNAGNQLVSDGVNTYTYDRNGSLIQKREVKYTYNAGNLLESRTDGTESETYTYTASGAVST